MKQKPSYEVCAAILERPIACYEEVEGYPKNRVRITHTDGGQTFIDGSLEVFYEMLTAYFAVSLPHCRQMAREVLDCEKKKKIMLPIVINPALSFMAFERTEGTLFVNRFSVNEGAGKRSLSPCFQLPGRGGRSRALQRRYPAPAYAGGAPGRGGMA